MKERAAPKGFLTQVSAITRFWLEIQMCHSQFEGDVQWLEGGNLLTIKHPARKCHVETTSL